MSVRKSSNGPLAEGITLVAQWLGAVSWLCDTESEDATWNGFLGRT